jgi:hypothetical protein
VNALQTAQMTIPNFGTVPLIEAPQKTGPTPENPSTVPKFGTVAPPTVPKFGTGTMLNFGIAGTNGPMENQQLPADPPAEQLPLDLKLDSILKIDRVLKARKTRKPQADFSACEGWMRKLMTLRGENPNLSGPDPDIVNKVLSIAPWGHLQNLLEEIWNSGELVGRGWGWFEHVLMQRANGVPSALYKERKFELRLIAKEGPTKAKNIMIEHARAKPPTDWTARERELMAQAEPKAKTAAAGASQAAPAEPATAPDPDFGRDLAKEATERLRMKDRARDKP